MLLIDHFKINESCIDYSRNWKKIETRKVSIKTVINSAIKTCCISIPNYQFQYICVLLLRPPFIEPEGGLINETLP